jgi:hypothetical protein
MMNENVNWYRDCQIAVRRGLFDEDRVKPIFSFVTLVSSNDKYDLMVSSFRLAGFDDQHCEFHAVDNTNGNILDGYSVLHVLRDDLDGRYIIFAHDDVEATSDTMQDLLEVLNKLEQDDPTWLIAGNAGIKMQNDGTFDLRAHINDPHGEWRVESHAAVDSLDENFLIIKNGLRTSLDLSGFHLFATDMCILARISGGSSFVIPFLVRHASGGTESDAFYACLKAFEAKYSTLGLTGSIQTPSSRVYFGKFRNIKRYIVKRLSYLDGFLKRRLHKLQKLVKR